MKVLVVDVGGSHVKLRLTGQRGVTKIDSGPLMTPAKMMRGIHEAAAGWRYDRVSLGYPGVVIDNRPAANPWNLGSGWTRFDFRAAFGVPVRVMNDAAMQALGSWTGGNMLFLGLGTGLGTAMVRDDGSVIPMELAHLPYKKGKSFEEVVGDKGMRRLGKPAWRKEVRTVTDLLRAAVIVDEVVIGGGNARHLRALPRYVRLGSNEHAYKGGLMLWKAPKGR